ncbi:sucrase-isomaltase, intestinal-like [Asterias rubens]|uniref:sucrase-isomaltase, intestinal-like n=1 Tax=Asterias rubens TaxID=7604 RepID=UPI001454FD09|nr:sucrase-isomaltase, intestinal-like [Asterias rubens]
MTPVYLLVLALGVCSAYEPWLCPTELLESERVDCFEEPGASEAGCIQKGCTWCRADDGNAPWCFNNTKLGYNGVCPSSIPPSKRADCNKRTNSECVNTGCVWCPESGGPWCFHDDNAVNPPLSTTPSPWTDNSTRADSPITVSPGCPSTLLPSERIDCYPEQGASEAGCLARGCYWCEEAHGVPWCSYPTLDPVYPTTDPVGGDDGDDSGCWSDIPEQSRRDCYPGGGASKDNCEARGCFWCASTQPGTPWCFFNITGESPDPALDVYRVDCAPDGRYDECLARGCELAGTDVVGAPLCFFPVDMGYTMSGFSETPTGYIISLKKEHDFTLFGDDMKQLVLFVEFQTDDRLHFKFIDAMQSRFEVPLDIPAPTVKASSLKYDVVFSNYPIFNMQVIRNATGTVVIDTSLGGFVYSDQYLQFATKLPENSELYGFGEHEHHSLRHEMNWQTMGMYSRDQPPTANGNLYGVHPFYMVIEEDFNTHGVLILNSNAQDVTLSPAPYLAYRTIGGVLDFYVFMGPTPENVVQQYTETIGRTFLPPYWSLGFQLCRYGYNSLDTVKQTVSRMQSYNIPHDVQYGDIDYMDEQRDFTYDIVNYNGLPEYVQELKAQDYHYIIILDPCIGNDLAPEQYPAYDSGNAKNVWITESDCVTPAVGKVWPPENSVFPDYTNPATEEWWIDECVKFHGVIEYDGLWIDMNEPANFGTGSVTGCAINKWNNPPYLPKIFGDVLADKTLCPDSCQYLGNHYDLHSLFGWSQSIQSLPAAQAATGKRSIVISRSTFPGSGKYAGHWLGDNYSQWSNLHYSIIGSLEFNMFGIPYIGADICGFNGDVNENLCQRWMQLGAFYTFSRNHNGKGYKEQDPAAFGDELARVSREILEVRYTLLPFLYTLFYEAHTLGSTVMRPLMHEFVGDKETHVIDRQFLWGPALLITPVLDEGYVSVDGYFPDCRWYDYYTGKEMAYASRGTYVTLSAPMDYMPLHVRGGHILPTQEPAVNTVQSRTNPMGLIVALDDNNEASGKLFWDDGDSIDTYNKGEYFLMEFNATKGLLTSAITRDAYSGASSLSWGTLRILGVSSASGVTVNGVNHLGFIFNPSTKELRIENVGQGVTSPLTITWN